MVTLFAVTFEGRASLTNDMTYSDEVLIGPFKIINIVWSILISNKYDTALQ